MTPRRDARSDVVVTGIGAVTALGGTAAATAAAVRGGIAGFGDHPYMIDSRGEPFVLAMAPYLEAELQGEARMIELARSAAREALQMTMQTLGDVVAIVGLPVSRPGLRPDVTSRLAAGVKGGFLDGISVSRVHFLPNGHSAGLMAIEAGWRELREGRATFVLAGGVDSYVEPDTLEWLDECERLHIPTNGWGFIPGEAAGFCVLCFRETATSYGLPVLGTVGAVSTANEPNRIYTETVCIGKGLTAAVRHVLASLPAGAVIDATICDQNGEAYRADECGFMLARLSEFFVSPTDFLSPADCWGDIGAASGPLFVSLASLAATKGYARGTRTLLWTSSESGERTALLFETDPNQFVSR